MNSIDKLNEIFSEEGFFEKNNEISNMESMLNVVNKKYPEITLEELETYLLSISDEMHKLSDNELSEESLENVAGGAITLATLALIGIAAYCGYKAGGPIGEFIYNLRH